MAFLFKIIGTNAEEENVSQVYFRRLWWEHGLVSNVHIWWEHDGHAFGFSLV